MWNSVVRAMVVVLLVAVSVGAIPTIASGQEGEGGVRIVAQRLDGGRVEFGLQQRGSDGEWGERLLPSRRFFPSGATVGRWLSSSPLTVSAVAGAPAADVEVRIVARRLDGGRVEFGLQQRGSDGEWGERLLPSRRFFPSGATVGRWLSSSPLTVNVPQPDLGTFSIDEGPRSGDTLIAASFERTCVVRLDGGVSCWGWDRLRDQLSTAVVDDVVAVSIGDSSDGAFHACVLHEDRTVSCWGPGHLGQLGQGDDLNHYMPVTVPGIEDAVALAAGSAHTCVAHDDGGVSCWGFGKDGQIGDGTRNSSSSPKRVPGLTDVVALSAGNFTTCGIHSDGTVSCWGWGYGSTPRKIRALRDVVSVAVGWTYSCAVTVSGQVFCWPFVATIRTARVGNITDAVDVSVGDRSACILHRAGGVSCFGENNSSGQLGDGTTTAHLTPRRLGGISDAVDVTVVTQSVNGEAHACAVHEDGSVSCWGSNGLDQLGVDSRESSLSPTRVKRFPSVRAGQSLANPTQLVRAWLDRVIDELDDESPWLRVTWDYVRDRTSVTESLFGVSGAPVECGVSDGSYRCRARLEISTSTMDYGGVVDVAVHELAHVYDLTTGLAPRRAWGAAQLYFSDTFPDCFLVRGLQGVGRELLADAMRLLTLPPGWLGYGYYQALDCPGVPDKPSREAEEVVRAALAGEVPRWYTENITNGAELWAALRKDLALHALANLRDEFGGLCTTDWISYPIDRTRIPAEGTNPFRDGGC